MVTTNYKKFYRLIDVFYDTIQPSNAILEFLVVSKF